MNITATCVLTEDNYRGFRDFKPGDILEDREGELYYRGPDCLIPMQRCIPWEGTHFLYGQYTLKPSEAEDRNLKFRRLGTLVLRVEE